MHGKNDRADILEKGLKLSPGVETSMGFSLKTSTYLRSPYGKCTDTSGYNQAKCYNKCLSNHVAEQCKCVDVDMNRKFTQIFLNLNNMFGYQLFIFFS